jgi:hypothetical protein
MCFCAGMDGAAPALRGLVQAMGGWQSWTLFDRPPLRRAGLMGAARMALVGDAAHPCAPTWHKARAWRWRTAGVWRANSRGPA